MEAFLPGIKPENKNLKFVGQYINKLHKVGFIYTEKHEKTMVCVSKFAYQKFDFVQKFDSVKLSVKKYDLLYVTTVSRNTFLLENQTFSDGS